MRPVFVSLPVLLALVACGSKESSEPGGVSQGAVPSASNSNEMALANSPTGSTVNTDAVPGQTSPLAPSAPPQAETPQATANPSAPSTGSAAPTATPTTPAEGTVATQPSTEATTPGDTTAAEQTTEPEETVPPGETTVPVVPEVVERPALITSGDGSYWQEGEPTAGEGGNPTLQVDESQTLQEWLGFGGTFNEAGWDVLQLLDAAERDHAMELLFDAQNGANFAWGRFPLGASDYAMDRYTPSEEDGDYEMKSFSIDRDKEMLIPYIKAALAVHPGLRLWTSPWSPPAWMKENGDINGGRIKDEPEILEAYALYFALFVEQYAAEGIAIEAVHPQNEPGYETRYPSCLWTADLLRNFVRDYLGPKFAERSVEADIWFGTMSAPEDTQHVDTTMSDPMAAQYIKGIGLQWNTMSSVGTFSSKYGVPIIQSEHKCGNYPWEMATFNPDRPPNDHAYAEESWGLIRDWIKAGVNAYSAWNMVLDTQGQNLDVQRPWPQNALLTIDRTSHALTATPAYYVFRHLSYFVDPGAVRLGTTGESDALAFKNPDGSIVTVIHNGGGSAKAVTLGVGDTTLQFEVPAHGWASVNTK